MIARRSDPRSNPSHSRFFWGLRLHLVCTPTGLPITFALASPKVDEREIAIDMFDQDTRLLADRPGQTIIADKGYISAEFERNLHDRAGRADPPSPKGSATSPRARQLRSLRQIIESVNDTLKGQLSLEQHGGHSPQASPSKSSNDWLALTAADLAHRNSRQPVLRSLVAYDH